MFKSMTAAVVVVAAVAVAGGTTGAVAGSLVTSREIRNGAVHRPDLSQHLRAEIRGLGRANDQQRHQIEELQAVVCANTDAPPANVNPSAPLVIPRGTGIDFDANDLFRLCGAFTVGD